MSTAFDAPWNKSMVMFLLVGVTMLVSGGVLNRCTQTLTDLGGERKILGKILV